MVDEYGDDIDKVMPLTVLDLHALAKERLADAKLSKENYLRNARNKSASAQLAPAANTGVAVSAEAVPAAAPVQAPKSTVTLIRNGAPIVVHTITPNSGRTQ
jgi:hypothetical protein